MRMVVALLVTFGLAACSGGDFAGFGAGRNDPMAGGFVLFESYRTESEWGYKLEGIYIDTDGVVWRYQHNEPWYPREQKTTVVTEADLIKKYDGAVKVGSVDRLELEEMAALIAEAAKGRVARGTPSLERDGSLDVAYTFVPRTGNFNLVFLRGSGDWAARNASKEARLLVNWLDDVKARVGFP